MTMSIKNICLTVITISLLLIAGCATNEPSIELLSGEDGSPDAAPLLQDASDDEGIITSAGTVIPDAPGESGPYSMEGSQPGDSEVKTDANWLTYVDSKYGFSVDYPDTYIVMDEPKPFSEILPALIYRVRFLESYLAKSDTANLQQPNFSVEVFENPSATPLKTWIEANFSQGTIEESKFAGASCAKVTLPIMIAPNEFYYCAINEKVFRVVALGQYSEDMLSSFKFGQ